MHQRVRTYLRWHAWVVHHPRHTLARCLAFIFVASAIILLGLQLPAVQALTTPMPSSALTATNIQESVGVDSCGAGTWTASEADSLWNYALPADGFEPRTIGGYVGGPTVSCNDVSSSWQSTVSAGLPGGWGVIPIFGGALPPASCGGPSSGDPISTSNPTQQGINDGSTAVTDAKNAGFYNMVVDDVEFYNWSPNSTCQTIVDAYLNGWVYEVQKLGLIPGVYGSAGSSIIGLYYEAGVSGEHMPEFVWPASSSESVWNISGIPNGSWEYDQRDMQYGAGYSYNGMSFDPDCIDTYAQGGLAESVWDTGASYDGGTSEGSSPSYDNFC